MREILARPEMLRPVVFWERSCCGETDDKFSSRDMREQRDAALAVKEQI